MDDIRTAHSSTTIAAIATPPGPGGIGVIRVSGPAAQSILTSLFKPHKDQSRLTSHRMTYGWILQPTTQIAVDEVMVVFMKAPNTYTREDVVEIQGHGSFIVLQEILGLVLSQGARLAQPGEFTKRAFLNGRIDLTRAEAVIELLQAKTREGAQIAINQLQGGLRDRIWAIREALVAMKAVVEVAIDFPDDDVEIMVPDVMLAKLGADIMAPLQGLIADADRGKIFRQGISVVILGQPNVGKSSLMNSLLKEDRAIVTEVPGTTRDIIEEYLDIMGMPVRIVDTAGIRDTVEQIEELGIRKARQKQQDADLVLMVVDGSKPPEKEDVALFGTISGQKLLVINKVDLAGEMDLSLYEKSFATASMVTISAKTGQGLDALQKAIFGLVTGSTEKWDPGYGCVPNLRHRASLARALSAASEVETALKNSLPPDLVAIDLQTALDELGDIIGETSTEDVLDMVFDRFCIGK